MPLWDHFIHIIALARLTACLLVLGAALGRQHVEWPVHLATSLAETVSMAAKCAAQVTLAHLT